MVSTSVFTKVTLLTVAIRLVTASLEKLKGTLTDPLILQVRPVGQTLALGQKVVRKLLGYALLCILSQA